MKPHKIYGIENIEGEALSQFYDAMKQPFVAQGALMPDSHAGYSLPIGAVVATEGVVVPAWVGFDIGCGMCAVPTSFSREGVEREKKAIFDQIYRDVPTGFSHNKRGAELDYQWAYPDSVSDFAADIIKSGAPSKQIGTLGGGNHFIEIGHDENDRIWIVIHSGSRNVGHKIATHYMKIASGSDKAREGHFGLHVNSEAGQDYIADLNFGLHFALNNRLTMIERIEAAIGRYVSGGVDYAQLINRNHNHAEQRAIDYHPNINLPNHAARRLRSVWIHRKGATHAEEGMMGVIPGNMRDGSFVVRGKGNPDSLFSSSHGAGRILSRKKAKAELNMDDFITTMAERGIQARVEPGTLDESPSAYKSIFEVMAMQTELVDVVHHIKPLINIKGASKEC